jgi:hypothetical protein
MLSLRDVRLILLGCAGVYLTQWILGVPDEWAPEISLSVVWVLIVGVTLAMILTEKADA